MIPTTSASPKAQIDQYASSPKISSGQSGRLSASVAREGRSWDCVRGVANPFHYLWKYGPLLVGSGLLLMARTCSAQVNDLSPCLKPVRYDPQHPPTTLERAWQVHDGPEEVRTLFPDSDKVFEAALDGVTPERVSTRTITPELFLALEKPQVVNLKDMTLAEGVIYNKTPYTVDGLYVVEGLTVSYLDFTRPVPRYTAARLGDEFARHRIVDLTTLGNNPYDFAPEWLRDHPDARKANARERRWVERMQMYQQFWANSPGTLCEINREAVEIAGCLVCSRAPCSLRGDSISKDPASGITTRLMVDPNLGAGTFSKKAALVLFRVTVDSPITSLLEDRELIRRVYQNLYPDAWRPRLIMSPLLVKAGYGIEPERVRRAARAMVHTLEGLPWYMGFHLSSDVCQADRCKGSAARAFADHSGVYTPANLVVIPHRLGGAVYRFELKSAGTVTDLRMRLLSYKVLSARILLSNRDTVYLAFDEIPKDDVHVSFYSKESIQMASVTLSEFTTVVEGKEAVSRLANRTVLADMLTKELEITIKTDNDAWLSDFYLPDSSPNRLVRFSSMTDRRSAIHFNGVEYYLYDYWRVECSSSPASQWKCVHFGWP